VSPARRLEQTKVRTRLARMRLRRGMTQREVWEATGIGRGSYLYLEHGGHRSPPLRHLSNCAIILGCKLEDLIEPEWRRWLQLDDAAPRPKHPEQLWKRGRRRMARPE
jgi:transcriptional regulator with XRE-family HTH domain